jgi:hypothetical protein
MARQTATSTSPSTSRGGKTLPTVPDGKTPRPPRRRKQQQTATKTPAAAPPLDDFSSSPDDEEYCFASSATGTSGAVTSENSSSSKNSLKARPSRMSSTEKENSINDGGSCHGRSDDGRKGRTKTTKVNAAVRQQQRVTIATKINAKSILSAHHPMQELNDSMAKVNLGRKNSYSSIKVGSLNATDSVHRMGPFPPEGFTSNTIMISTAIRGSPKYILRNSLQMIEKSGQYDLVWKLFQVPSMMDVVASASFSLGPSESMLLEENTTKLIDTAKRCLKSLSSSTSGSTSKQLGHSNNDKVELELALLRVALYSLRSILPTILESSKSQSMVQVVIKLLYHCVVVSGDCCHGKFETFTTPSTSSSSEKEGLAVMEHAMICLGAYEGLGKCLKMGSLSFKNKKGAVLWDELIPLPDSEGVSFLSVTKILPHRQLVKISMESALCASSSFFCLSLMSLHAKLRAVRELWTVPSEFHFATSVIDETCSGEYQETATFQKLLLNVAHPFVMQSLFMAGEDDDARTLNVDALVKKGFRILWDGARSIEDVCTVNNSPALKLSCLGLKSEAIHFVLQSLKSVLHHLPGLLSEERAASTVMEILSLFNRASSSAMKSAGVFLNVTESDQTKKSALVHFHDFVGAQLDLVAIMCCKSCGQEITLPSSYYEYCAYRLIHRWRLLRLVDTEPILTSLSSDKNLAQITSSGDAESMVGVVTSTVIHTILVALQSLKIDSDPVNLISDSECERIISNFELIVINNSPTASQNRCRSMLTMLDLKKEVSYIISSVQSETPYSARGSCIAVLASVLWRCYAPLETKLSQSTKDQTRSLNFLLASADSYAKSASLFSVASEDSSLISEKVGEYAIKADTQLHKCYEMLVNELERLEKNRVDRKAPIVSAIDIFAKVSKPSFFKVFHSDFVNNAHHLILVVTSQAASFIGKRRYERKVGIEVCAR